MRRKTFLLTTLATIPVVGLLVALRLGKPPEPTHADAAGPRLVWAFEAPQPGFVVAAPVVSDESIFLAVGHLSGFDRRGAVYAIDPTTGHSQWVYDRCGEMLPTASTPLLAGNRLFVGEGLHSNFACRLDCLDARTGESLWTFPTNDHIEGGPALADDAIIFPAGNDGLYALDANTGKKSWSFTADLHIDSTPWVENGRVFAGSGPSRRYQSLQVIALDGKTGRPIWRTPVKLPAWSPPVVAGERLLIGLGNGRLATPVEPPETPAGALACFDVRSGAELWTFPVPDAVFGRPAVTGDRVAFGSRDGNLYGVSFTGKELFHLAMGGPVMAAPLASGGLLYCVSVPGRVVCVNPADGRELWRYELNQRGAPAEVYASPRVLGSRLFVVGELKVGLAGFVCLHCLELPHSQNTRN